MVQSKAKTVPEYLAELPEDHRKVISTIRNEVLRHLPAGYQEAMSYGMISYEIPLERFPNTYNGHPLTYIALAAQKNHYALYVMCLFGGSKPEGWLKREFEKAGKKLNMGKSCLRFKKLDDLPLHIVGQLASAATPEEYIKRYEASRAQRGV
jgi:hypothetical protein